MKFIFPYLFTLVYWFCYFTFVHAKGFALASVLFFLVWFVISAAVVSGKRIVDDWSAWLNLLIFFISSYGLLLVSSSQQAKNIYIFAFGLLSGFIIYTLLRYTEEQHRVAADRYLRFVSFIYLVSFWQVAVVIDFMVISFDASSLYAAFIIGMVCYAVFKGILASHYLRKSDPRLVTAVAVLTTVQLTFFLELLPLHYFVFATLTSLWLLFIIEMVIAGQGLGSRRALFHRYLWVFLAITFSVLVSAVF